MGEPNNGGQCKPLRCPLSMRLWSNEKEEFSMSPKSGGVRKGHSGRGLCGN